MHDHILHDASIASRSFTEKVVDFGEDETGHTARARPVNGAAEEPMGWPSHLARGHHGRQLTKLAFPTHDGTLGPLVAVHRIKRQRHAYALKRRYQLHHARHVVRLDARG